MADEENKVITREEAMALGLKRYFTGRPCKRGHVSQRKLPRGECCECQRLRDRNRYAIRRIRQAKYQAEYRAKHKERLREQIREYSRRTVATRIAYNQEWRNANKERYRALQHNYKARKRAASGSHTASDIKDILRLQRGKCAICCRKLSRYSIDHIQPLSKGGSNDRKNIQLVCLRCNSSKKASDPIIYMRILGRLL